MKVERNSTPAERKEFRAEKLRNKAARRASLNAAHNKPEYIQWLGERLSPGSFANAGHDHTREIARRARQGAR